MLPLDPLGSRLTADEFDCRVTVVNPTGNEATFWRTQVRTMRFPVLFSPELRKSCQQIALVGDRCPEATGGCRSFPRSLHRPQKRLPKRRDASRQTTFRSEGCSGAGFVWRQPAECFCSPDQSCNTGARCLGLLLAPIPDCLESEEFS